MPLGRPTDFTEELGDEICGLIGIGTSLNKICGADDRESHLPCRATVYGWFRKHPAFLDNYTRAKEDSGDADQDKLDEIAEKVLTGEIGHQEARVAADIIKWSAGKKRPKKYGDKIQQEHSGAVDLGLTKDQLLARANELLDANKE